MDSIYRGGVLNIAATGFADGSNGLFVERNPDLITPICVSVQTEASRDQQLAEFHRSSGPPDVRYDLVRTGIWSDGVTKAPLSKRGWVLQERALSVRTVHFGKQQLFWECLCQMASEVHPSLLPKYETMLLPGDLELSLKVILKPRASAPQNQKQMSKEISKWVNILEMYSKCLLTYPKDKLVAISGMAKFLGENMNSKYLAGLWEQDVEHQLLWRFDDEPSMGKHTRKRTIHAPSWSWASIDAPVTIPRWDSREEAG
jgi:hypothetical protein